jgi:hypothetical protein
VEAGGNVVAEGGERVVVLAVGGDLGTRREVGRECKWVGMVEVVGDWRLFEAVGDCMVEVGLRNAKV